MATIEPARRLWFEPAVEVTPFRQLDGDSKSKARMPSVRGRDLRLAHLSRELGINPKTMAKWRRRAAVEDMKTGPLEPRPAVLTKAEEAMLIASRRDTLRPLDNYLHSLQA